MSKTKIEADIKSFERNLDGLGLTGRKGRALFTRGIQRGIKAAQRIAARQISARLGVSQKHILDRKRAWLKLVPPKIGFGWGSRSISRVPVVLLKPRKTARGISHSSYEGRIKRHGAFQIKGKKVWFRRTWNKKTRKQVGRTPIERVPGLLIFFQSKDVPAIEAGLEKSIVAAIKQAEKVTGKGR